MKTKYGIVVPISGSAGTRNPIIKYLCCTGALSAYKEAAYLDEDRNYFKQRLKELKKENPVIYKKAFVADFTYQDRKNSLRTDINSK